MAKRLPPTGRAPVRYLIIAAAVTVLSTVGRSATEQNWPGFRGPKAAGIAAGQRLPDAWNGASGANLRWKVAVPGLAHSSPIVWNDRVFITSAISSRTDATFKPGLYGDGTASEDRTPQRWVVIAIDARTGKTVWQQTAYEGVPKEKRHIKATYANATPVTDGRYVVAFFGSQGLYAYDMSGRLAWKKDLGVLDVGAYDLPEYEWGTASSPVIYKDLVIVQCDTQKESFVMASDIRTGKTVWKTVRQELPSWGTPTIYESASGVRELVTNASNYVRGYDPDTGAERWRLGGSSKITAPTPIFDKDVVIVASGRAPERPIFAIRPGGSGDITPPAGASSGAHVLWSKTRARVLHADAARRTAACSTCCRMPGCSMPTTLATGTEVYRQRVEHGGSGFSASPVAADGRIYLSSEDGDMFVVRAGASFELLARTRWASR